jgi:adenylylsulfate kinase-like enzyme
VNFEIEKKHRRFSSELKMNNDYYDIYKIVLTGGPCAGKTTAITTLADKLRE